MIIELLGWIMRYQVYFHTAKVMLTKKIDQFTRRFTAIIDPILVVGIGGLVGVIVLAVGILIGAA